MKCLTGSVPDTGTPWKSKCESSYEKRSCGLIWLPERAMPLLRTDGLSGKTFHGLACNVSQAGHT